MDANEAATAGSGALVAVVGAIAPVAVSAVGVDPEGTSFAHAAPKTSDATGNSDEARMYGERTADVARLSTVDA